MKNPCPQDNRNVLETCLVQLEMNISPKKPIEEVVPEVQDEIQLEQPNLLEEENNVVDHF